jgi:hypothetical protein
MTLTKLEFRVCSPIDTFQVGFTKNEQEKKLALKHDCGTSKRVF